ncbi:hypothetical protein GTY87_15735 [Streptomyces sp. SID7813]|uniref:Uncharacterized protein n=1 Tax=Streptomyces coelicolor (strain ATCC BAA-471 / A3(2) / M145) TaxID=100226 RepID=Q9KZ61_STRCO|nr:hypothetical protein [Streptomyces sp. SID7813]QFI43169.1 hypothetical protein FQ762_15865 [Streptomyces coelicolor A3(2)]THA98543.1 hypothetical protein E6R61_06475 [Streptomyces sp. LRa12]CAB89460.1 hypothetical protein SCE29c [Streptomyces coelicolor A3(2)]
MLGDVVNRPGRTAPCSQPLFRFRGATSVGRAGPVSYLRMTADPDGGAGENGAGALVETVKSRHSAYSAGGRTQGCWHVLLA